MSGPQALWVSFAGTITPFATRSVTVPIRLLSSSWREQRVAEADAGGTMTEEPVDWLTEPELRALAKAYSDPLGARQLLSRAGLAAEDLPLQASTPMKFWRAVNDGLVEGALPLGRREILRLAVEAYPANPIFTTGLAAAARSAGGLGGGAPSSSPGSAAWAAGSAATSAQRWFDLPTPATVFTLDAVGYSKRGMLVQLAVRDGLRQIVATALSRAGIPQEASQRQDRGDGYLGVISAAIPKAVIVADLVRELEIALRAYNRTRDEQGRIRLRVAIHEGDVLSDSTGWAGDAVVVGARLVDAQAVRDALAGDPDADLAVILSSEIFDATVRERLLGLDPGLFQRVEVSSAKFSGHAWLTVPGRSPDLAGRSAGGTSGGQPAVTVTGSRPDVSRWNFFVSVAQEDEVWGSWIAWYLEEEGYRVHLESWDVQAGNFDIEILNDAVQFSERTIVVLSPAYLASERVAAAWQHAWRRDASGLQRTLIPVRVEECEPGGLLSGIRYVDLVGLDDDAAKETLKEQIRRSVAGYYRPATPPPFPGRSR